MCVFFFTKSSFNNEKKAWAIHKFTLANESAVNEKCDMKYKEEITEEEEEKQTRLQFTFSFCYHWSTVNIFVYSVDYSRLENHHIKICLVCQLIYSHSTVLFEHMLCLKIEYIYKKNTTHCSAWFHIVVIHTIHIHVCVLAKRKTI